MAPPIGCLDRSGYADRVSGDCGGRRPWREILGVYNEAPEGPLRVNGEVLMDAVVKSFPKPPLSDHARAAPAPAIPRPTRAEAEAAVRTLIAYVGDDPGREGL